MSVKYFLLAISILGILFFGCIGVVKPPSIESCQVQVPFECVSGSYVLHKSTDTLTLSLNNTGFDTIKLISTSCGASSSGPINPKSMNSEVAVGETVDLEFDCKGQTNSSAKIGEDIFQKDIYITYYPRPSDPDMVKTNIIRIATVYR
jgi:hypothetical protein